MARESKRRRDEKRFGKPERLADVVYQCKWGLAPWFKGTIDDISEKNKETFRKIIGLIKGQTSRSVIVSAHNISDYYYKFAPTVYREFLNDFPNPVPPYDSMFMEVGPHPDLEMDTPSIGWALATYAGEEFEELRDRGYFLDSPNREAMESGVASKIVVAHGFSYKAIGVCCLLCRFSYLLDGSGRMLVIPQLDLYGISENDEGFHDVSSICSNLFAVPLMALSFMNCKNVVMQSVEPDAGINKERKKAGLDPFLRYHTINIEPMKAVLRTEGGIEANGLKKALHIVRGHFATYSPEKPLFGHFSGTVWKPSHVKGSAKEGVVVSDYAVHSPRKPDSNASDHSAS